MAVTDPGRFVQRPDLAPTTPPAPAGTPGLIPIQYSTQIIQMAQEQSLAMRHFRNVRMPNAATVMPVLDTLPVARWVTGELTDPAGTGQGKKNVTGQKWKGINLVAEELATIVVIPEAVIEDASIDLWAEITPASQKPSPQRTTVPCSQASRFRRRGTCLVASSLRQRPQATSRRRRRQPRRRTSTTQPSLRSRVTASCRPMCSPRFRSVQRPHMGRVRCPGVPHRLPRRRQGGQRVRYARPLRPPQRPRHSQHRHRCDDRRPQKGIVGTLTDLQYKILTEATIDVSAAQDGSEMVSLAQQDLVALRVRGRFGFATANPVTYLNKDSANRFPFSVIKTP